MRNTVTVSENTFIPKGETAIHRELSCTCGWEDMAMSIKAEAKARHHILYNHGTGTVAYAGLIEPVDNPAIVDI